MASGQTEFSSRFGQFVRDHHAPRPAQETAYPLSQASREIVAHHLILLALLARADGEESAIERKAILDHILAMLARNGRAAGDSDREKLDAYIAGFHPSLMQLDPALRRLEAENAETKIAFLEAARAVVMADGKLDPAEARRLDRLKLEFAKA
ncbi:MAG: TerB family tellurite resistance protein [Rhizomicrobium sp.]